MKGNLKKFRTDAGLSLQELGDMCGTSKGHMHELESDKANPRLLTAYGVAAVLEEEVTDIWPNTVTIVEETITVRRVKG